MTKRKGIDMEKKEDRVYVDKDGEVIDLSVVYGVYKTQSGLSGFFQRCTNYSPEEIGEAVDYIMTHVQPKPYDDANARRMMAQIEGTVHQVQPVADAGGVRCPACGSTNLQIISDVQGKGAKFWKLCLCGFLGLCGTGKTTTTHYWVCKNCGKKFKV